MVQGERALEMGLERLDDDVGLRVEGAGSFGTLTTEGARGRTPEGDAEAESVVHVVGFVEIRVELRAFQFGIGHALLAEPGCAGQELLLAARHQGIDEGIVFGEGLPRCRGDVVHREEFGSLRIGKSGIDGDGVAADNLRYLGDDRCPKLRILDGGIDPLDKAKQLMSVADCT